MSNSEPLRRRPGRQCRCRRALTCPFLIIASVSSHRRTGPRLQSSTSSTWITATVRAQAEHALAAFMKQHLSAEGEAFLREAPNLRAAILREAEKADLVVMGASAQPFGAIASHTCSARCPSRSRRARSRPSSSSRPASRSPAPRSTQLAREPRRLPPPTGLPRRSAQFRHASIAGSASRTSTIPSSATSGRLTALKAKQGTTVSLVLPTSTRRRRSARSWSALKRWSSASRCSTRSSSSTRLDDRVRARSPRTRVHGWSPTRGPDPLWHVPGQGRGPLEAALRDVRGHRRGADTGAQLAPPDGLRDARPTPPRAAAAVRQGLLPAPDRGTWRAHGGRRRPGTELVARPLINLFFPELSGLIQPLAGEYAGRRSLLESILFFTATPSRSATSSMWRSALDSKGSARSTSSAESTATRSSRACRGCPS